jgi:histidinol-phosphate/aromatic aminotransferase/cobyric acid decarboxylase-like protein
VAVVHGGVQADELVALGLDPVDVLDLSANLNPRGPHPHVLQSAREADLRRYPDAHAIALRDAIAEHQGLEPSQVLVTPGATGAIHLAARALLRTGDECALWPPTFGEYAAAITAAGARAIEYATAAPSFTPTLDVRPATMGMLCNPNNPTGTYLARREVEAIMERLRGPLLLDVAYDPFVADPWDADDLVRDGADALVVHSMTKLHAIPGIRLGYVTGSADRIAQLSALQPSWAIGAQAIAAGNAMLAVDRTQRKAVTEVTTVRASICADLAAHGIEVVEGRANFLLARVGHAAAFRTALLRRGFAVRDCASFGLPEWVRMAVPVEAAARRLLGAFHAARVEAAK